MRNDFLVLASAARSKRKAMSQRSGDEHRQALEIDVAGSTVAFHLARDLGQVTLHCLAQALSSIECGHSTEVILSTDIRYIPTKCQAPLLKREI